MTPRENTAQFSSAPPLKILNNAATFPPVSLLTWELNQVRMTAALTPGQVIAAPTRTTISRTRVRMIRLRSSGILKVFVNAEIMKGLDYARTDADGATSRSHSNSGHP